MRRIIKKMVSLALIVCLFTGCSAADKEGGATETSGSAVSGSPISVSESAVRESVERASTVTDKTTDDIIKSAKKVKIARQAGSKYANDHNKYAVSRWGDALFQGNPDAESDEYDQAFYMDIASVQWVTNDWLYYTRYCSDGENEQLWRIPIEKTKKGDTLKKYKKEKLLKAYDPVVVYATDSYLILKIYNKDFRVRLCKYDPVHKKLTELLGYKKLKDVCCLLEDESENPIMLNGDLIIEGENELFHLNPETGESASFLFGIGGRVDDHVSSGSILYLLADEQLYQYDGISRKTGNLIEKESFINAADQLGLGIITSVEVSEMYLEMGRIYFIVDIDWRKKGEGVLYQKSELYSAPEGQPWQFRREDTLMDWLDERGWYEESENDEKSEYSSFVEEVRDGIIYAYYLQTEGGDDYKEVQYDLVTKEIKEISEKVNLIK